MTDTSPKAAMPDLTPEAIDALVKRLRVRGAQEHERPNHYVRRMEIERHEAASALTILEARVKALTGALQWCSGSPDFNEGGQARKGWLRVCAPLLHPAALSRKDTPDAR